MAAVLPSYLSKYSSFKLVYVVKQDLQFVIPQTIIVTQPPLSSLKVDKKNHWLHVASTKKVTLYEVHEKRGLDGIKSLGIYKNFKGVVIHDGWKAYSSLPTKHALCNTHHLRELQGIEENYNEAWTQKMSALLRAAHEAVEKHRGKGELPRNHLRRFEQKYANILKQGFEEHAALPSVASAGKKRGRKKQRKGKNLLDRLRNYQTETLRFLHDFQIPFTNNQAERDVRMMKAKQKISGCFRTKEGAILFGRIRGYLSTARKQGWNIVEALEQGIRGQPLLCTAN